MNTTDSWTSRHRTRDQGGDASGRRSTMTLGEWLDGMSADEASDSRSDRTMRRRERNRRADYDDADGDQRVLSSAMAQLDARERRMERRTDDMLEALDRWMERSERSDARRGPSVNGERLDSALDQIERRLDAISGRIDESLSATASARGNGQIHSELDARLADIARRIDAAHAVRRADPREQDRLARLETSLDGLIKRLETRSEDAPAALNGPRRRSRPDVAAATAEIRAHQLRLEQPAAPPAASVAHDIGDKLAAIADRLEAAQARTIDALAPAVDTMRSDIAALAAKLAPPQPTDISPLREQLESLKSAIIGAISEKPQVDAIRNEIALLGRKIDQTKPQTSNIAPLQDQIASLAARLDAPPAPAQFEQEMAALRDAVVGAVRERDHADPARLLDGLEMRIDAAGGRISNDVRSQIQVAILELRQALDAQFAYHSSEPIAEAVRNLSDRFDASYAKRDDGTALVRIESQISALAKRFERLDAEPAAAMDGDQLERLADEMRAMAREIDPSSAVAKLEDKLQALDAKLDDVKNRPVMVTSGKAGAKVAADLAGLETLIRGLTDRMEAVRAAQAGAGQVEELQAQIREVAEKIDRADGAQSLSTIERSVADLFSQIDSLRNDRDLSTESVARQAAEAAAREVADDLVRRAAADLAGAGANDPRIDALADDVGALRRTNEFVDRKTHETLEAIHTVLEKIVERIGAVERDVNRAPAAPEPIAPMPESVATTPPAVESARPSPSAAAKPAAAAQVRTVAPTLDADAPLTVRLTGRRQAAVIEPASGKSKFSFKLPFLSRSTGSDAEQPANKQPIKPAAPAAAPTTDADLPLEPGSGRPSAPAPRVNDAAATAKANFIAAARRAAQIATDEAAANAKPSAADAAPSSGKSLLETRKKPILIGLAALLLAVIAINVLTRSSESIAPPPTENKVSTALPSASAPIERDAASRAPTSQEAATKPQTQASAQTPAPTEAAAPTAPMLTDPTTVGSIPRAPESLTSSLAAPSISEAPELPSAIASPSLRAAALKGDPAAAHEVGVRLFDGRGVSRDPKLALKWFERAANEGLAPAQFRVGNMYEKGVGAARDAKLAKLWYQRAAEKGNAKALHNLGVLIAEGGDGKPDYAVAADYFLKAAKLGVRDSQYNIAILLARGLGVSQSMTDSYMWLSVAAQQGDDEAGKKRDEIGQRLSPEDLSSARAAAQAFKPATPDRFANDVATPEKGWDAPASAASPARSKGKADGARS